MVRAQFQIGNTDFVGMVPRSFVVRRSLLRCYSTGTKTPLLLTPSELLDLRKTSPVSLLDASWFMPNSPRNAHQEFLAKRLPGAQFLDLDKVASPHELGLKHMMPSEHTFAEYCGEFLCSGNSSALLLTKM
jgi:thiosulfate/3-mercaptopyruvate sulfurtransferase